MSNVLWTLLSFIRLLIISKHQYIFFIIPGNIMKRAEASNVHERRMVKYIIYILCVFRMLIMSKHQYIFLSFLVVSWNKQNPVMFMNIRWLDILYIFCVCLGCSSCLTTPSIRRASDVCKRGKVVHHCFLLPGRKTRHGIYLDPGLLAIIVLL